MDEAAIVSHAFNISLIVLGVAFGASVIFLVVYAYYYERKHRRYVEHKTQENKLPVLTEEYLSTLPKCDDDRDSQKQPALSFVAQNTMSACKPTVTSPDLDRALQATTIDGKGSELNSYTSRPLAYSVEDTIVDMCIPREVLDFDGPITRLNLLKARDDETSYFDKIKEMVDGI